MAKPTQTALLRYSERVDTSHRTTTARPQRSAPTLREQQKELTRRRLIEAATEVFGRDGYASSRVEDIAFASGVSRATFYLHFKAKIDIVRELMGPLRSDSVALYRELDAVGDPTWDQLSEWMTRVIDYWRRNRTQIMVLNQAIGVEPELASFLVDGAKAGADAMTNFLACCAPATRETARLRVTMFILQLERVCYLWIIRDVPFDPAATLTALTDSFDTALHPSDHAPS